LNDDQLSIKLKKRKFYFAFKRLFDLFFALLGLIVLLPVFILTSFFIIIDSKGLPLFIQERAGKNGKPFKIFKFRTMRSKAPIIDKPVSFYEDDRVTKVGRFLRKTKIDELPQLINVFLGHMSFVGPRPLVLEHINLYTEDQRRVLLIKPGITDLASITFRKESDMLLNSQDPLKTYVEEIIPKKVELNLIYMHKMSFFYDIYLIFKTIISITKL
jgi:lipopolysaccharide/colanic/teichoic acid biosynthesis glycosyltransferase